MTESTAITLIKHYEGCRLTVYNDNPKQPDKGVLTVGYGHTGKDVDALGLANTITQAQADEWLDGDIYKTLKTVTVYAKKYGYSLVNSELDALTSFVFNLGSMWLLKHCELGETLASKQFSRVPEKLMLYHYQGGMPRLGLYRRRYAEGLVFQGWPVEAAIREADSIWGIDSKPQPRPTMRLTASKNPPSPYVPYVQECFRGAGFGDLVVFFGLYDAVTKFQGRHNLQPDGIIGPLTWAKLDEVFHANLLKSYTERGLT